MAEFKSYHISPRIQNSDSETHQILLLIHVFTKRDIQKLKHHYLKQSLTIDVNKNMLKDHWAGTPRTSTITS